MKPIDISTDKKSRYVLKENERAVFLIRNRSGKIMFELAGKNAGAEIIALYDGKEAESFSPIIIQKHTAPHTTSKVIIKARLKDSSSLGFEGRVEIAKSASGSDAHQECRALLLSEKAHASAKPTLEIKNRDVTCSHAATIAPLNPEHLFYMATRGIDKNRSTELLSEGFMNIPEV